MTPLPFEGYFYFLMKKLPEQNPEAMMFRHIQLSGHYYNTNGKMKTGKVSFPHQLQFEIYMYAES